MLATNKNNCGTSKIKKIVYETFFYKYLNKMIKLNNKEIKK